ncbi:MAG: hypothetical protein ACN6O5_13815 [Achromobacter sp.]|uniref:hypothetical protein n=1 Tax=Achromobacter sp. TaxID=134375 RepID=UPI003D08B5E7
MKNGSCVDFLADPRQHSVLRGRKKNARRKKIQPFTIALAQVFDFVDFCTNRRRMPRRPHRQNRPKYALSKAIEPSFFATFLLFAVKRLARPI